MPLLSTDTYPIAEMEIDGKNFTVDVPIQLYGRNSHQSDDGTNPGDGIHSYSWDFGGEAQDDANPKTSTDTNPTVTYSQPGEKTVTLTVWDNDPVAGGSGSRSGRSNSQRGKQIQARRTFNVAGSISVTIHSETANELTVDTDEPYTPITIFYEIEGNIGFAYQKRVRLEIRNEAGEPVLNKKDLQFAVGRELSTTWNGVGNTNKYSSYVYGLHRAVIILELDRDAEVETEADEWEEIYRSDDGDLDPHDITVDSHPVADAGEDRVVAIDTTTDLVIVPFDGSNSYDPDDGTSGSDVDGLTDWEWSFTGTDLTQDAGSNTATTETVDTPYRSAGTKMVTLTVSDRDTPALDDEDTAEITVIDVEIDAPTNDEKLTLSNSKALTPPPPTISVQGSFLPTTIPGPHNLDWEITIGGNTFSTTTDSGGQGTISLSGPPPLNPIVFPSSNNDFGPKKVKLTVTRNAVTVSREQPVVLFFEKRGYENGTTFRDGTLTIYVPNWYVFWSQTKASHGTHRYAVSPPPGYPDAFGYYVPGQNSFFICNAAAKSIDEFAKTCVHELEHKRHYDTWWSNPNLNYVDTDGDSIPDSVEMTMHGFDHTKADSNGDGNNDDEELCMLEELKWSLQANAPGSTSRRAMAYEQDWSHGGEQWKRR